MSNEELAARIKAGEEELLPELWNGVKRFVRKEAFFWIRPGQSIVEPDDLVNSAYFAMLKAVDAFDGEYLFLTYLKYHLRHAFRECCGLTGSDAMKTRPRSLDEPVKAGEEETVGDLRPDPVDWIGDAETRIWLDQLREAMQKAVDSLPDEQRKVITGRYYRGRTIREVAEETGTSPAETAKRERKALERLRKHNRELEQYVDARTDFFAPVEREVIWREQLRGWLAAGLPAAEDGDRG